MLQDAKEQWQRAPDTEGRSHICELEGSGERGTQATESVNTQGDKREERC